MVVLTRDLFDAIEFDAAWSGDHRTAAQQMSSLAVTGTQTAAFPRSEAYLRAGEQWLLADDPAEAATGFRRALEEGGPAFVDPRVPLARALFMMDASTEAEALIGELEAEQPRDPQVCDLIAELLVERSDLPGALRWATAGVELCLGRAAIISEAGSAAAGTASPPGAADPGQADPDEAGRDQPGAGTTAARSPALALPDGDRTELRLLLNLRYRIRNDLGLPEDSYDKLLDELPPDPASRAGES